MQSSRLGILKDRLDVLVEDLCLKSPYSEAKVPDDCLEAFVVGNLLELKRVHLLKEELDTFNPGVDIISFDEVLLGFDKVLVVLFLNFEPKTFVLAKQSEEAVSHTL
jgi:hypothetical protein